MLKIVDFSLATCYNEIKRKKSEKKRMIYDFDELSFQVLGVLEIEHPKGFFKVSGRPYSALSYRVSGIAEFDFDGERITSNPGDVVFIPEGAAYDALYSGGEMIVIHLLDCNYRIPENITVSNAAYVAGKFSSLLSDWERRRSIHKTKSTVYSLMQYMYEAKSKSHDSPLVEKAKEIIDGNYQNPEFNIATVAKMLYTSTSTLRRNFGERFGISPKQYLLKVRLDTAISLLSEGFLQVNEVAKKCGFEDERYFSRIIKARYGVSPSKIGGNRSIT